MKYYSELNSLVNTQLDLKDLLRTLESIALEKNLDFCMALDDFEEIDESDCIHYDAFPCEDGSVYCPTCETTIVKV